jgi:hypothetical protein
MKKRYARNPGADQIAEWKAALAAHRKRQRQQHGQRHAPGISAARPGMMRRAPADGHPGETTARSTGETDGPAS